MKYYYQVVTTPTADTPGSCVVLHFPDKRYLFGQVAEGTQRACGGRSVKFGLMTDIFLTGRLEMKNVGGLFGVILTLADSLASSASTIAETHAEKKKKRAAAGLDIDRQNAPLHGVPYGTQGGEHVPQRGTLTIHGGRNLTHMMATARKFIFRQGLPMFMKEHDEGSLATHRQPRSADPYEQPTWSDQNIKVWVMAVSPKSQSQSQDTTSDRLVRSKSPRKRSHDEFQEKEAAAGLADQVIRQNVVSNMFNSTWSLDALEETKLADVQMPAVMFVRDPATKDLKRYKGPAPGSGQPLPDMTVLVRKPWPGANVEKIPPTTWNEDAISYIVRNHDLRGKFDTKKAQALKVRKGPDYAKLTRGESVLSEDGQVVTPDMVLGEPRLGKSVAIIDLPTPAYVENLVNRPEWDSPAAAFGLEAFIWILGPGVGDHPKLHEFVAKMSHCKHTVSSPDYCPNYLAMKEIAESTMQMAQLRPDNYKMPVYDNVTVPQPVASNELVVDASNRAPLQPLDSGLIIDMEPTFGINTSEVIPRYDPRSTNYEMPKAVATRIKAISRRTEYPEFQEKLAAFRNDLPGADVEIITLGTGSSIPSKFRNVSSTLVHAPGYGYYLLDCGEGTLGQLKRLFEPEELLEVFKNMKMIWISHLHADHHLGIANVIKAWYQANYPHGVPRTDSIEEDMSQILRDKRLFVVCEEMMTAWLEEYASAEDYGFGKVTALSAYPSLTKGGVFETYFVHRHCRADGTYPGQREGVAQPQTTTLRFQDDSSPLSALLRAATGLSDLLPSRVQHCRGAMAVTLAYSDGFKLSFSGDCRPSDSFAATGRGSTVLIHEATFQNDMAGSAIAKKHSTFAEAMAVARQMEAKALLLTHFSQRYQRTDSIENDNQGKSKPDNGSGRMQTKDVPDDDEPEDGSPQLAASNDNTGGVIRATPSAKYNGPYVNAFDYMRVRVGEFPIVQAYVPAMEKLFLTLEQASQAATAERARLQNEFTKQRKQAKQTSQNVAKVAKFAAKNQSKGKAAAASGEDKMDVDAKSPTTRSLWSASESESGWSTSEDEGKANRK
ncbi:ribonuclease Z [Aspergillus saccharolyticus JOP 1030-1]|uniref:ribonuclease Z n=1 Tax=Aspergillus saccharolyticus JOP 1030-1 TaxID=1450539 RepID=A0A318ZRZ5_9EURO|nr:putative tRNA processing endoribonuclease Trz1 [Aspergillus saccharolyticus JOP 1030-1]PYH49384.1 putative tRNA processing endoribonuclease Trz1 [Aspergillus saccharolyticus JOP 1030-1]